ncbi:MAG: cadherin-like domain-containing protein [Planctomycetales bacterium]|nr:cadherin-like domain-containing protein [Planctomycetales bacterium]
MTTRSGRSSSTSRRRGFEPLELRQMLDAGGVLAGADLQLTFSFAPDGAQIAGQSNALAATFDALAPAAAWQETILHAFQTWAIETNADIGLVGDEGQDFGVAGPTQGDPRFGDVRIGAIAMEPSVGAVSVPTDGLAAGTWFADVVFNTAFNFTSLDDLYAIALHEAGNVFGLKDNTDPNSPLSSSIPPVVKPPTAADLAALQDLHGVRAPDANEAVGHGGAAVTDNDSFANATQLKQGEISGQSSGSAPTVVYGDIATAGDSDYFTIRGPGSYAGPMTIKVRTAGISLLAPRLQIYDASEQFLGEATATDLGGGIAEYQLPTLTPGADYFIQVDSAVSGEFAQGGYSLTVVFDGRNSIDQATIDHIASGAFRFLSAEEIAKLFDGNGSDKELYGDDMHGDDEPLGGTELPTLPGFVKDSRYQIVASIADAADVDNYVVKSPKTPNAAAPLNVLTAAFRSLDAGGLAPKLRLLDEHGVEMPSTILSNGNGEYIIQATGFEPEADMIVEVAAADPGGFFDTGNYELTVAFGRSATQVTSLASATIGDGVAQRSHTLYVGEPQLFHFALQADPAAATAPAVLIATIVNDQGEQVFRLATRPGDTRTGPAVFLPPGTYSVEVVAATLDGSSLPEFGYTLSGTTLSDPFVGDPNDPTANPFACTDPNLAGFFCYPGVPDPIISADPFLWDNFVDSLPDPPTGLDLQTLISLTFGDWWQWVWNNLGVNGPVFAQDDTYHTMMDTPLSATGAGNAATAAALSINNVQGVLSNDIDPEGGEIATILASDVAHGTLQLAPDGGFTYTPDPGFRGIDQFTYQAFDFVQKSNVGVAKIVVGVSADFNASGSVGGSDFLAWQRGYGATSGATLALGDTDLDGDVDANDLATWQQQFAPPPQLSQASADGDGSQRIDGGDFLVWQRGYGATTGATTATGDYTGDGAVDSADLSRWAASFGDQALALQTLTAVPVAQPAVMLAETAAPALVDTLPQTPLLATEQLALPSATNRQARKSAAAAAAHAAPRAASEPTTAAEAPPTAPAHDKDDGRALMTPRHGRGDHAGSHHDHPEQLNDHARDQLFAALGAEWRRDFDDLIRRDEDAE